MTMQRQNQNQIPRVVASVILILLFLTSSTGHTERGEFKVKEVGNKLEVTSPWGTKSYEASTRLDVMKNYKIEIPLDDLRPVGAEHEYRDWFDEDDLLAADLPELPREVASVKEESTTDSKITVTNLMPSATPAPTPVAEATPIPGKKKAEEEPDDTARMIVEANRFYNQGKYYEALLYVEEVLRKKPQFVRAWVMKGSLLYVQGHKDLAKEAWENVLKFEPENQQIQGLLQRYK